jgi:imidazolonepropionase-like amidohydrolase
MNKTRIYILALLLLVLAGCSSETAPPPEPTATEVVITTEEPIDEPIDEPSSPEVPRLLAVINGTIIDSTGADPIPNGVVVVEDGRIIAVGARDDVEIPDDAIVVDGQGGTILPGLVAAHSHVIGNILVDNGDISSSRVLGNLSGPLKAGITTIMDFGSHWGITRDVSDLRDALSREGNFVPNIFLAGPVLAASGSPVLGEFPTHSLEINSVDAAKEVTKELIDQGVDLIKIIVGSVSGFLPSGTSVASLSEEQIKAITQAAHEEGVLVFAHAVDDGAATMAITHGVDGLAHCRPGFERCQKN